MAKLPAAEMVSGIEGVIHVDGSANRVAQGKIHRIPAVMPQFRHVDRVAALVSQLRHGGGAGVIFISRCLVKILAYYLEAYIFHI